MELWIHGPCLNSIWTVTSSEIFLTSCQVQHFQSDCVKRSHTSCLPVERQPLDPVTEHHPRCHQQLCKEQRLDAFVLVLLELNPWSGQQLNGVLCIHIFSGEKHVSHCYYLYSFHNWFANKGEQISQLQIKRTTFKSVLFCASFTVLKVHRTKCMKYTPWDATRVAEAQKSSYVRLNLKLNCHVDVPGGYSPCSFMNVRPSWIILSKSTLQRSNWYW